MQKFVISVAALAMLGSGAASAQTFTFTTLDNPGDPTFNQLLSINDKGTIAGYFGSGAAGHPNIGYEIAAPYTAYTAVMQPGSVQTQPTGVNNAGAISGFWAPTNTGTDANFAFAGMPVGKKTLFLSAVFPGTYGAPQVSQALGINNTDVLAGFYVDGTGISHAYTFAPGTATFTTLKVRGAVSAAATSINDNAEVAGFGTGKNGKTFGFVQNATGGVTASFTVPGTSFTQLLGINNSGIAVGFYNDSAGKPHGLYYNATTGAWITVDDPDGVGGTVVNGINNENELVGFYTDAAGNVHGMLITVMP